MSNINAAIRYFQLHNKATIPLATEVPLKSFVIPAGTATQPGVVEIDSSWFAPTLRHTTGIGWAVSTTAGTFTDAATASDHTTSVNYV